MKQVMTETVTPPLQAKPSSFVSKIRRWVSDVFPSLLVFVVVNLAITLIFLVISPPSSHTGTLRPESSIAPKELELFSAGLAVGLVASLAYRRLDVNLVTLAVAFVVLLDMDHLPAFFGINQPIRPAHSLAFLAITLVVLYFVAGRRGHIEIPILFASAFFAHMAADTGVFAFFAPVSFNYYSLQSVQIPFIALAVCIAALAGYVKNREKPLPKARNSVIYG